MPKTISGLVTKVVRTGGTPSMNPRMTVTLATPTEGYPGSVDLRIQDDAQLTYEIENVEYRDVPHVFEVSRGGRLVRSLGVV